MNTTSAHAALLSLQTALAGRYVFERELGRGGMATVYLARDLEQDRDVAVKVLIPELAMAVGTERFLREIEVATTLQHPRIIGVLDSGRAPASASGPEGILYYTMPVVEGGSLRDRLDRVKQLPIEEAIATTRQVAEAIAHAHANGVIHRDIKPENILFDASGALVADFGVARAVSVAGGDTLTRTGVAVGTPTYMSPEQAVGGKDVTPASDIYSLACVLYEMLAGQPPFTAPTAGVVLARHVLDTPPNLRIMRSGVTVALEDAIARGMSKSPADRHRSVTEFAAALTDHEGAARRRREPNVARSLPEAAPLRAWWRRPVARALATLALPIILGGLALGWRELMLARPSADLPRTSVAVLYLEDGSGDKTLGDLANVLTEGLIRDLDELPQLDVASRNGSRFFKAKSDVPIDSIARALRAGTLLTGRVRPVGPELRFDLELWDGTTGWRIGKRRLELPSENRISLQDSLARAVGRLLRTRIGDAMPELVSHPGTRNPEAWSVMQRALRALGEFDSLRFANAVSPALRRAAEADSILSVAQETDQSWEEPHIDRAWLAFDAARLQDPSNPMLRQKLDSGLAHAAAALELAPNDSRAIEARGMLRYWIWLTRSASDLVASDSLLAAAERDLTAVASGKRSQAGAWNALSHLRINKGELRRSETAAERALQLDPFLVNIDRTIFRLFSSAVDLGYPDDAMKWCREGFARFPQNYRFTECKLWLYALPVPQKKPDMQEVWKTYDEYVNASPPAAQEFNKLHGKLIVGLAFLRAGLPDSAKALAEANQGNARIDPRFALGYYAAVIYAQAGDKNAALELMAKYFAANPQLRADDKSWWLKDLRSDPRYQALVRQKNPRHGK